MKASDAQGPRFTVEDGAVYLHIAGQPSIKVAETKTEFIEFHDATENMCEELMCNYPEVPDES